MDKQEINAEPTSPQSAASLGEVLWAAREAKKLTVQDASNYLRYSVKQIVALEANAFSELPDATITRGFIRNYARYLDLDAEPLLASYRARVPQVIHETLHVKSDLHQVVSSADNRPWLKYILGSILALLFLVAWLFYLDYMPKPTQTETLPLTKSSSETQPTLPESSVQQPIPSVDLATLEAAPAVVSNDDVSTLEVAPQIPMPQSTAVVNAEEVMANPVIAQNPPVALNQSNSEVGVNPLFRQGSASFSEETWMQVKDKTGKIVYENLAPANSVGYFKGIPPFEVVIGNVQATKLMFLNKDVNITAQTKNNVARVRLE